MKIHNNKTKNLIKHKMKIMMVELKFQVEEKLEKI